MIALSGAMTARSNALAGSRCTSSSQRRASGSASTADRYAGSEAASCAATLRTKVAGLSVSIVS
ncbi:hypothetical protein BZM27_37510 [Paraburkholderia steynii]|uniref:Uncharacterized protein n=1 Tax=Paraburkholderia steynii TaxID=1245441 RepID=A0A4R0X8N2_9BURK|nr:hypothetical protein BZM27_37510 [Paraburkholderia steynii]